MSLANSKEKLQESIFKAFDMSKKIAKEKGKDTSIKPDDLQNEILKQLAFDLSNAINEFAMSADVDIADVDMSVPSGITVSTNGTAASQVGTTTANGNVTRKGFGKLK